MKILMLALLMQAIASPLFSQITNKGTLFVKSNYSLFSKGNITNKAGAKVINNGTLDVFQHITNDSGGVFTGNGAYKVGGNWNNQGHFTAGTSTITFYTGTNATLFSNNHRFYRLELQKTNANVTLTGPAGANKSLTFTGPGGHLLLGNFNFTIGPTAAAVAGATPLRHLITNGEGSCVKENVGPANYIFPVGFDADSFNRLTLKNTGTPDHLGVRCLPHLYDEGLNGTPVTNAPDVSWVVTEATAGGSILNLTAQWYLSDEQANFNRHSCALLRYDGANWGSRPQASASGTNPYARVRNSVSATGVFGVATGIPAFTSFPPVQLLMAALPTGALLEVYPNPASSWVQINCPGAETAKKLAVYDAAGHRLLHEAGVGFPWQMDTQKLEPGNFFVKIWLENGQVLQENFAIVR